MNKGGTIAGNSKTKIIAMALTVVAAAQSSQAARVLVKMHSPADRQLIRESLREALKNATRDGFGQRRIEAPFFPGSTAKVLETLDSLNMAVVETKTDSQIEELRKNPKIAYAEKEIFYPAPKLPLDMTARSGNELSPTETLPWGIRAVKAPQAWAITKGAGVKVVVLDSGIDRDHPDLAKRLKEGKNFVSKRSSEFEGAAHPGFLAAFARPFDFIAEEEPAYDYFDLIGHGTHVAGTILADGELKGVAPDADLYAGRVCGKFGCSSVGLVNGINWAIGLGADVINMSLGGPMSSQAQEEALNEAFSKGVIPVAASGNDGTDVVGYPAAYDSVIAVGAVDEKINKAGFSQYGPELDIVAPGVDVYSAVPMGSGRASLVKLKSRNAEVKSTSFVGSPILDTPLQGDLIVAGLGKASDFTSAARGKIALVSRGEIPFAEKAKNAIDAGARGLIVYNNEPGLISGAVTQDGSILAIPVVMIEQTVGNELKKSIEGGATEGIELKTLRTNYTAFQGTSMASPHVAGVVALIRGANKRITPAQVQQLLASTAVPTNASTKNEYGKGFVNADSAVKTARSMATPY
jgi:serine protease